MGSGPLGQGDASSDDPREWSASFGKRSFYLGFHIFSSLNLVVPDTRPRRRHSTPDPSPGKGVLHRRPSPFLVPTRWSVPHTLPGRVYPLGIGSPSPLPPPVSRVWSGAPRLGELPTVVEQ